MNQVVLPVKLTIPNIDIKTLATEADGVVTSLENVLTFAAKWGSVLGLPEGASLAEVASLLGVIKGLLDKLGG